MKESDELLRQLLKVVKAENSPFSNVHDAKQYARDY